MENTRPPVAVGFDGAPTRPAGWQVQQRVEFVVNRVMRTHRGRPEEAVLQALHDQLRSIGVVPNQRQVQQYAEVISRLPELPPGRGGST